MTEINSNLINDDNDNIDSQDLHSIYNDNYNKNVDLYPIHSRNNKHYIKNRIKKFFKFDGIKCRILSLAVKFIFSTNVIESFKSKSIFFNIR